MRVTLHDHDIVRLVSEKQDQETKVYRVEVEGSGILFSSESLDAAVHYLDMLIHPLIKPTAA